MIDDLINTFRFPQGKAVGGSKLLSFQEIHNVAVALGASCPQCGTKSAGKREKAFDRGDRAAVLARARARRFALDQDLAVTVAEADSPQR